MYKTKFKIDRLGAPKQRRFSFTKVGYYFGIEDDDSAYICLYNTYYAKHNTTISPRLVSFLARLRRCNMFANQLVEGFLNKETIID